jgi:hypothetical protein
VGGSVVVVVVVLVVGGGFGRVVVVVAGGRVVVVLRGRVVLVVGGLVVVSVTAAVVVVESSGALVDVVELELEPVGGPPSTSSVVLVEVGGRSTWVPSTSAFPSGLSSSLASTSTSPTQAATTHQNHRPSRTRCTGRRYLRRSCGRDLTLCARPTAGAAAQRCADPRAAS